MPNTTITVGSYRTLDLDVRNLDGSPDMTTPLMDFGPNNSGAIKVEAVTPPSGQAVRQLYVTGLVALTGGQVGYRVQGNGGIHNPIIGVDIVAAAAPPVINAASAAFGAWGPETTLPHP